METVSVFFSDGTTTDVELYVDTKPNHVSIEFMPGNGSDISKVVVNSVSSSFPIQTIQFVNMCVPDNAIYVRWINNMSGFEYAMFTSRLTNTLKTNGTTTFRPYLPNFDTSTTLQMVLSREAENTLVLGAYQVTRNEFMRLRGLLTTPKIDIFDPVSKQWLGAFIPNQTSTYEGTIGTMDFELEVAINERLLQTYVG